MPDRFDAVTFDFWDTLCRAPDVTNARERRMGLLAELLADLTGDEPRSVDQVEAGLRQVLAVFNQHWSENRQFTYIHAAPLLVDHLGVQLDQAGIDAVARAISAEDSDHLPDLAPNVEVALRALKDAGLRIGIICDVGLAPSRVLRRHLNRHGVLDLFDHWSFSDEVGHYKPAAEIFHHALAGLGGIEPRRAAHVGDLRRTDIAGALAMGITAVRYAGITDDPPEGPEPIEADHVISDHAALAPILLGG